MVGYHGVDAGEADDLDADTLEELLVGEGGEDATRDVAGGEGAVFADDDEGGEEEGEGGGDDEGEEDLNVYISVLCEEGRIDWIVGRLTPVPATPASDLVLAGAVVQLVRVLLNDMVSSL